MDVAWALPSPGPPLVPCHCPVAERTLTFCLRTFFVPHKVFVLFCFVLFFVVYLHIEILYANICVKHRTEYERINFRG